MDSLLLKPDKPKLVQEMDRFFVYSLYYHGLFDYPLTGRELIKWSAGDKIKFGKKFLVNYRSGFFYLAGQEHSILKRLIRKRNSIKKMRIAKKATEILKKIPFVMMVGVTGSLSMENSDENSDIDLIVVTKKGKLWTSRFISYLLLGMAGIKIRRFGEKEQKDRLCLNIWIDETSFSLGEKRRNPYTAHEIASIKCLFSKEKTYEKFMKANIWISDYWPNVVGWRRILGALKNDERQDKIRFLNASPLERIFYWIQMVYMRKKITRETVTPSSAFFHPFDWSRAILPRLKDLV